MDIRCRSVVRTCQNCRDRNDLTGSLLGTKDEIISSHSPFTVIFFAPYNHFTTKIGGLTEFPSH